MKFTRCIPLILLLVGCSSNGLNKPITEELTVPEIRANLKKDPLFEDIYSFYKEIGTWLITDNVNNAKYGSITYKQMEQYNLDTPNRDKTLEEYERLYPNSEALRKQADSIIAYYRGIQPDSLLLLKFKNKTTRRTILGNMPEFHITVTPLKGKVEQFRFEYYFSEKIQGEQNLDDIVDLLRRRGYQDTPVSSEKTITYLGELWTDILENVSNEELHRDYNFLYKITNVRYKGKNWEDLPISIKYIIRKGTPYSEFDYDRIIADFIDNEYVPFLTFYAQKSEAYSQEHYPEQSALVKAFYTANPDYYLTHLDGYGN